MNFVIGLAISVGCMLGGYAALGGHLHTLVQPFEFLILGGAALGIFVVANPVSDHQGHGARALSKPLPGKGPKQKDFLEPARAAARPMREMRSKSRGEVEAHIDNPEEFGNLQGPSGHPAQPSALPASSATIAASSSSAARAPTRSRR